MIPKNVRREKTIFVYWNKKYSVNKIHQLTGIARSTVGYYVRKFNAGKTPRYSLDEVLMNVVPKVKTGVTEGSLEDILGTDMPKVKTGLSLDDILKEEEKLEVKPAKLSKEERTLAESFRTMIVKRWIELMSKDNYTQAKTYLESNLVYMDFMERWNKMLEGMGKITFDELKNISNVKFKAHEQ